jgi:hypothetical protein
VAAVAGAADEKEGDPVKFVFVLVLDVLGAIPIWIAELHDHILERIRELRKG